MPSLRSSIAAVTLTLAMSCTNETPNAPSQPQQPPPKPPAATTITPPPVQAAPRKPCSHLTPADLQAVAGPGAKCEDMSAERGYVSNEHVASYEFVVRSGGAAEMLHAKKVAEQRVKPVPGLGDEAYAEQNGLMLHVRKGDQYVSVASERVFAGAPKIARDGVRFLATRILANP